MVRKVGRRDSSAGHIIGWVLLCCGLAYMWHAFQLHSGHEGFKLGKLPITPHHLRASDLAGRMNALLASAFDMSVPDVSPLALEDGGPQDFSSSAFFPTEPQLSFAASGPFGISSSKGVPEAGNAGSNNSDPTGGCRDVHPNADSPDMLHVVFASDLSQIEGVMASVVSVVDNCAASGGLTVHIMVQQKWMPDFKMKFGIHEKCVGTVTGTGVLITLHSIEASMIQKSVAQVSSSIRQERGAIDSVENFARFYMHELIERGIVVYLDADTIVQADLGQMREQLWKSGKTIGFVDRKPSVYMHQFLLDPKDCNNKFEPRWKDIMKRPAYNVGVFAVDMDRWKRFRYWERVEEMVAQHNQCNGTLWKGGSQPPLLLAFMNHPADEPDDFMVFDASWNAGDLGWRGGISTESLAKINVLHWNGNKKPWFQNGLYRPLWLPHRIRFDALIKPDGETKVETTLWLVNNECDPNQRDRSLSCDDTCLAEGRACDYSKMHPLTSEDAVRTAAAAAGHNCESFAVEEKDTMQIPWDGPWIHDQICGYHKGPVWQGSCELRSACGYNRLCPCKFVKGLKKRKPRKKRKRRTSTTTPSPEQIAAVERCPQVSLLDDWSARSDPCVLEKSFGCGAEDRSMWADGKCEGVFSVSGEPTVCGDADESKKQVCEAGTMRAPTASCGLMILTSFFTTKKDWQRHKFVRSSFAKFQMLYRTVFQLGLNVTVFYDDLPESMLKQFGCERWTWHKVSLDDYDSKYGVNDVRYFFFARLLQQHTEWRHVFVVDAFDVVVRMNPCHTLQPGKLYVGSEEEKLVGHPWMKARYGTMGGKYEQWYDKNATPDMNIFNCGITGGDREVMMSFFEQMIEIQSDPNLPCRLKKQAINVNMAALNYIAYNRFYKDIITGPPLHSAYKRLENHRRDVWFIHK